MRAHLSRRFTRLILCAFAVVPFGPGVAGAQTEVLGTPTESVSDDNTRRFPTLRAAIEKANRELRRRGDPPADAVALLPGVHLISRREFKPLATDSGTTRLAAQISVNRELKVNLASHRAAIERAEQTARDAQQGIAAAEKQAASGIRDFDSKWKRKTTTRRGKTVTRWVGIGEYWCPKRHPPMDDQTGQQKRDAVIATGRQGIESARQRLIDSRRTVTQARAELERARAEAIAQARMVQVVLSDAADPSPIERRAKDPDGQLRVTVTKVRLAPDPDVIIDGGPHIVEIHVAQEQDAAVTASP